MTISYRTTPSTHGITVESSAQGRVQYPLSVGENGNLSFETPERQSITVAELGSELPSRWKEARM